MTRRSLNILSVLVVGVCMLALTAAAPAGVSKRGAAADVDWNAVAQAVGVPRTMQAGGVEVAAIHNHLLWEKPTVMYMHVMVTGDAVHLAQAVHDALALTKTPLHAQKPSPKDQKVDLDTAALDQTIGVIGKISGGVYKFSIAPKYQVTSGGMTLPPSMGTTTGFAFQPLGKGRAAITGDFALLGSQVNPVIRALRANGILVTALHSHMLDAQPTVFFMHFFATGDAIALARGLRAGLDAMA